MDINEQTKATSLKQSVQQQLRMLCDASDKCLRMQADDHLNHSQQADCDVKTRRADLQLPSVQLTPKSTRTYYDLLKLQRRPYTVIMVALCDTVDQYFCPVVSFFFVSSPNLSGRTLDVYHTSTHGVVLVQI